jgi:hypothetical protein
MTIEVGVCTVHCLLDRFHALCVTQRVHVLSTSTNFSLASLQLFIQSGSSFEHLNNMEGLSAASSIIAVVSLAFQIGASIQKLCDFWDVVEDGTRGVRAILTDLHVISNVLEDIRSDASLLKPHSRALNACLTALEGCRESVEALSATVNELQPGFSSQNRVASKFAALKIAWKADKIRRFQETLRDMKITLTLARLNYME